MTPYLRLVFLAALFPAALAMAQTTRYAWTNSPSPGAPFTNWTTAARSLQAAIDVCAAGDVVVATDGVYAVGGAAAPGLALMNRVCLSNAIVVRSVNGPAATIILGQGPLGFGAVRGAFLTNGATLSGFRLEIGATFDYAYPGDEDRTGGGAFVCPNGVLTNCRIVGNMAAIRAGGVYGRDAVVANCAIAENEAEDGGGAYLDGGALRQCTLSGNLASPGYGGGARVVDGIVSGCTFVSNNGYWGGGLMLEGGSASDVVAISNMAAAGAGIAAAEAVISHAHLAHNTAYDRGGGAYLEMCWLTDSVVSNNDLAWQELTNQPAYGAGIASTVSRIENCVIADNWGFDADDRGGGLACAPAGTWTNLIVNCSIRGNSAGDGGGIFVQPAAICDLSATGTNACELRDNVATNYGGGICTSTQAVLRAQGNVLVSANQAGNGGGLAVRAGSQVVVEEAGGFAPAFSGNAATNSGGGLFAAETTTRLALRAVQFQGNVARGDASFAGGGGLALYGGAALIGTNLVFVYNQCPHGLGGAVLAHNALAVFCSTPPDHPAGAAPRTQFLDNLATNQNGGAVYAYASQLSLQSVALLGNQAARGGAVHVDTGSTGRFGNVVMAGNAATLAGGGLRAFGSVCDLRHCTLYGNEPDGASLGGAATAALTNCIAFGNADTNVGPGFAVAYSDVGGGYGGTGNVDVDPAFHDVAALDFHLTAASVGAVVDAGSDAGLTNDCVFRARPLGAGFDLGAYEYRPEYDDSDGDGMPDAWESDHGLDPLNDADRIEPDDGDGVANFDEYLADTDPQDSNDFFRLTDCAYNPVRPDRGIFVGFTSSSNRLYSLQSADVPADDSEWRAMPGKTHYLGVGSYDGFNDTNAPFDATARVYRVVVAPVPE